MSGSPSPENRFDPLRGDKRRKRSNSPIPHTTHGTAQPILSYAGSPGRAPGSDTLLSDSRRLSAGQPGMSIIGLPAIGDPQLRHTLQSGALLPARTTPLPPRSTRRAKAHVASACESCVDVRHKRRGRPPLKAEEGPLRPYEPAFGHPGVSRPQPQSSSPASQFYSHRRASSSREIRPSTELQPSRRSSDIGGEHGRPGPSPAMPNPQMWAPPTASRGMPTSSPIPSTFSAQIPFSSNSSQQSPAHTTPLFSPGARSTSAFTPEYRDVSRSVPPFHGERIQPRHSPRQYQRPHIPPPHTTGPTYFPGPGSPHGPLSSPPLNVCGGVRNYPFSGPGQSQIQLPPLMPSTTGPEFELSLSKQRPLVPPPPSSLPSLQPGHPNSSRVDHAQELEDSRPLPTHPPFQPATFPSGPAGRGLLDAYRPMPLPPQPQTQQATTPQQSSFMTSNTLPPTLEDKRSSVKEKEGEPQSRPAKRQKMALGDMVND